MFWGLDRFRFLAFVLVFHTVGLGAWGVEGVGVEERR